MGGIQDAGDLGGGGGGDGAMSGTLDGGIDQDTGDFSGDGGGDATTAPGAVDAQDDADLGQGQDPGPVQQQQRDFANLQKGSAETTAWIQQQTWQNETLPNLAGPTMTPAMMNATV